MIDKTYETIPKSYLDLVKEHPLLPIVSEAEEEAAKNLINLLLDLEAWVELTEDQDSYLATLTVLLHDYQRKKTLIPDIHGIDLLKLLIKEHGLRQQDLVSIFKTKSIVSMILSGKRNLTVEHIQKLADYFKCSPSAFFPR
ncbi:MULTISPECIES: helix-turn-helix domain-containing protein [unclassified Moorena]|uniref:helix-turn-helix domain-containing protein n=1 Tax=unclassified Moorena TaxID=2683338 RepID=UPI00140148D4|nr:MULTISPECIES: helix-turn-helix domain-containing protein [unclassified Moorena]NEO17090.1 helix-turn-helix domain-containing protein [Moorena sp. SIO3E8]NEQ03668.1 helix-turn-helix domain-containing protein [Moorena sp. SIO3F7]